LYILKILHPKLSYCVIFISTKYRFAYQYTVKTKDWCVICWSKFYKVKANFWWAERGPSPEAWAEWSGDSPLRYGSLLPPIYTPCKPPARVNRIIKVTHNVCKHSRYSEVLLVGARGFYLSLLERVFHVKILCSPPWFLFRSSLLPIAFITADRQASHAKAFVQGPCFHDVPYCLDAMETTQHWCVQRREPLHQPSTLRDTQRSRGHGVACNPAIHLGCALTLCKHPVIHLLGGLWQTHFF
jgi:hypothetical protein